MSTSFFSTVDRRANYALNLVENGSVGVKLVGVGLSWVTAPITIALSPFTAIADIVSGLAKGAFHSCRGSYNQETRTNFYNKVVLSPIQHITFLLGAAFPSVCVMTAASLIFPIRVKVPMNPATKFYLVAIAITTLVTAATLPIISYKLGRDLTNGVISEWGSKFSILHKEARQPLAKV